ncbi:MAG TPA: hypothetical protein VGS11_08760 [Candidatus Bathyarchaeia archaeon]|nr:hypothetical protein [Candidatus Bathyarchaeia archaeon]
MLSLLTLQLVQPRYLALMRDVHAPRILERGKNRAQVLEMAHPSRVKSKIAGGIPHMPFQEFTATSLEQLLAELKKAKIPDARVEVSTSEDGRHYACSKPLVNVLVYTSHSLGEEQEYKDLIALYQYCPDCKNAVRVL